MVLIVLGISGESSILLRRRSALEPGAGAAPRCQHQSAGEQGCQLHLLPRHRLMQGRIQHGRAR